VTTPCQRFKAIRTLRGCQNRVHAAELTDLSLPTIRRIEMTSDRILADSLESYAKLLGLRQDDVEGLRHGRIRLDVRLVKTRKGKGA